MDEFNEEGRLHWDHFFLDMSLSISKKSRDPSTKVGAVIATMDNQIVSVGYNGFPRGVKNLEHRWLTRPDKYNYIVHAERNAVLNAAREGRSTKGCKLYIFFSTLPCEQCTLDIIQSGITEIILGTVPFKGAGNGKFYDCTFASASHEMLREAGVSICHRTDWNPSI